MNQLKIGLLLSLPLLSITIEASKETQAHVKHVDLRECKEAVKKAIIFLDGQYGRIDGNNFGLMLNVRSKMQALLLGDRDPKTGHRTGHYLFLDKYLSIEELADIEMNYVGDAELNALLVEAKAKFEVLFAQFIAQAKGTKSFLVTLIEESCHRRNRKNSVLLTWATSPEGNEMAVLHEIPSFRGLSDFCHDLINFLEDLMFSCPLAKEQFIKKRDQYTHDQNKQ